MHLSPASVDGRINTNLLAQSSLLTVPGGESHSPFTQYSVYIPSHIVTTEADHILCLSRQFLEIMCPIYLSDEVADSSPQTRDHLHDGVVAG